jgi:membrane protein DedA with SNARE-associated domain/membrane-associated phospholipid phosphatase
MAGKSRDPAARKPASSGLEEPGVSWRLIALIGGAIVAFMVFKRLLPHVDVQQAVEDIAKALGDWTYLLVGVLAFGETGAFIGLVLPGEAAVILGGAVAGQGVISLPLMIAVAWLAAFLGDTTGFTLGHRVGRGFLLRHGPRIGLSNESFRRVEGYFSEHGGKTILIGRFISFVRPLAPFLASGSGMRYRDFVPYSILGTGLWAAAFVLLGYFGSRSLDKVVALAERGSFWFGVVIAVIASIWLGVRFFRRPANRKNVVDWMERQRALRPVLAVARRFRRPAQFAWARVTPGRLGLELTSVMAVLAVSMFVLIAYTAVIAGDPGPTPGDLTALHVARDIQAGWLTSIAKAVTQLGSAYVIVPLSFVSAVALAWKGRWAEFWVLVVATTLIFVAVGDMKSALDRPRPAHGLVSAPDFSFPSGHAAHSIFYVWLGVTLSTRLRPGLRARTALVVAGLVVAGAIGLTRVYLQVHYMSDVSAGWALGAVLFSLFGIIALLVTHLRQNDADGVRRIGHDDAH